MIRLPAHLEVSAIRRRAEVIGGNATVISKGDPDSGSLLLLTMKSGEDQRLWERMPSMEGGRQWVCVREQVTEKEADFEDYLRKRTDRDLDSWLIELDIPEPERFIAETPC